MELQLHVVEDAGDLRGSSWSVPEKVVPPGFVVRDIHVMTMLPGSVRGDHFHQNKREIFVITYLDDWTFFWEGGSKTFRGIGCAGIAVPVLLSHAISNTGQRALHVVALTDCSYDPRQPDATRRKVSLP